MPLLSTPIVGPMIVVLSVINFLTLYLVEYQKKGSWEFGRMIRRTKLLASFSILRILTKCSLSELPMLFVEAADQKELNLRHN